MSRVKVIENDEADYMRFQFGTYCILMFYAFKLDEAKAKLLLFATCTERHIQLSDHPPFKTISSDELTGHFVPSEIIEVLHFINRDLIPALLAETEDLDHKYGGYENFEKQFYEQTSLIQYLGVDPYEYYDFTPDTLIFDLENFRKVISRSLALNKAPIVYLE